ncbi:MAG: hypothetical protein Q9188_002633 [Gyalolechia gomerana]
MVTDVWGEFKKARPCEQADLPQSILERILLCVATQNGFKLRWGTRLLDFEQDEETVYSRSRYLCGAKSFSRERQPVGQRVVKLANDTGRLHAKSLQLMGVPEPDAQKREQTVE